MKNMTQTFPRGLAFSFTHTHTAPEGWREGAAEAGGSAPLLP